MAREKFGDESRFVASINASIVKVFPLKVISNFVGGGTPRKPTSPMLSAQRPPLPRSGAASCGVLVATFDLSECALSS